MFHALFYKFKKMFHAFLYNILCQNVSRETLSCGHVIYNLKNVSRETLRHKKELYKSITPEFIEIHKLSN